MKQHQGKIEGEKMQNRLKRVYPGSNLVTALASLSSATYSTAGLSQSIINQTYLRDGEKLWGPADSPRTRREDTSNKKFLKPGGCMLSCRAVQAGGQASCLACRKVGLSQEATGGGSVTSRCPAEGLGRDTRTRRLWAPPGGSVACEDLGSGSALGGVQVPNSSSGESRREVIRNSCTSRWFILTF